MKTLRILRFSSLTGFLDYATVYTWRTWLAGWYVRVLAQVIFFALIGKLLLSEERVRFLLVGNATVLAAVGGMFAVAGTTWERRAGTLPLLVASPSSPVVVFAGRSVWALTEGILSSAGTLYVAAAIFGVSLPWPRAALILPMLILISSTSYALGLFLGGLVLRAMSLRNVVGNVVVFTIMAVAGVNVPLSFDPQPVRLLAHALPLTNGLVAVRETLGAGDAGAILTHLGAELGVGVGWLALALLTFDRLTEHGRRDGSIEFAA